VSIVNFAFDSTARRRLGYELIDLIDGYFESLPNRAVQVPAEQRTFAPLRNSMPERGALGDLASDAGIDVKPEDALAGFLRQTVQRFMDEGFHLASANYFGLMNPTPTYAGVLGEALAAALNPQLATMARSQLASKIEAETLRWFGERFGWQQPFDGTFTSGGNEANFSGLALALAKHFPAAVEEGVAGIGAQATVYASVEAHHSLDKSMGLLGLGRKALRKVGLNEHLQMNVAVLQEAIAADRRAGHKPFCVVATAGTTNSGIIDDIATIAEVCEREGLWLHLDGAYGAAVVFSDKHRELVQGIERCDSVTIDPHKWLAVPYAAGIILTRHPETLYAAFGLSTPYMPKPAPGIPLDNYKVSTQWTRRMNSLKVWLTLQLHGRLANEEHIDRQMQLAAEFAAWVEHSEYFELAAPQMLPIVNLRLKHADEEREIAPKHIELVEKVTRDGRRWVSETRVAGKSVVRVMVISYLTGREHLLALQDSLLQAAMP
jgi:glutamate/tyrosine decarboxylase-like PLP-dependent enzyme